MNTYIETYTKRYGRLLFSLSGLLLLLALAGCRDSVFDRDGVDPAGVACPSVDEGQEQEVQIPYLLPSAETMKSGTRALDVDDESTLDPAKTHLLVFDAQDKLLYEAKITGVEPTAPQRGNLTARLKKPTDAVSLVLYANVEGTWKAPAAGTIKADVAKSLTFSVPADMEWADGGRLPMWGEANKVTLDFTNSSAVIGDGKTLHLIRSVARIDVGLNLKALTNNGAKDGDFNETAQELKGKNEKGQDVIYTLKSVALYRVSETGFIAPTDVTGGSDGYSALTRTRTPALPTEVSLVDHTISDVSGNIVKRSLYVPETANPQDKEVELSARPRLVVGLGRSDWGDKVTYYPIDFLTKNGTKGGTKETFSYLHLLRNVRYKVSLLGVNGPGFDTPDHALEAAATRLSYVVIPFAESDMDKVAYDGPYTLSVDEDLLEVGRYGSLQDIGISTTWPEGWSVEVPSKLIDPKTGEAQSEDNTLDDWVDFEGFPDGKPTNQKATNLVLKIKSQAEKDLTARTGCFLIRAGRMTRLVRVHQSVEANLEIAIFSDPEAKVPLQFIELSQRGLKAKSVDEQGNPLPLPGYRRFYVRTEPYFNPNTVSDILPMWTHAGGDRFLFYDYGSNYGDPKFDLAKDDPNKPLEIKSDGSYVSSWRDPFVSPDAHLFRYTGRGNVWECVVTATPMNSLRSPEDTNFFERKVNTFIAELEVPGDRSSRVTADLRMLQVEYIALPYDDQGLTEIMVDEENPVLVMMDGEENEFFMTGNTPYTLRYLGCKSDVGGADDLLIDPLDGVGSNPVTRMRYVDEGKRNRHTFTPSNDMKDPKRYHGYATYEVSSPDNRFDTYTFRIELVSAIKQPEANTYLVKADSPMGILIPVSMVNTAADYYQRLIDLDNIREPIPPRNDRGAIDPESEYMKRMRDFIGKTWDISLNRVKPHDVVTPWMIWTDVAAPTKKPDGSIDMSTGGVKRLRTYVDASGKHYIYFLPSGARNTISAPTSTPRSGSVLIGARNESIEGSPNVWSWHIWLVDEYPRLFDMTDNTDEKHPVEITSMDRPIGARRLPDTHYIRDTWSYGFAYQWGRKDPFPWRNAIIENAVQQRFWDDTGELFSFPSAQRGTRKNQGLIATADAMGATFTLKQSIQQPASIVSHQTVWMTEHLPFGNTSDTKRGIAGARRETLFQRATWRWMWEMPVSDMQHFIDMDNLQIKNRGRGLKSPFDPSPYGFRIMTYNEAWALGLYLKSQGINTAVEVGTVANLCTGVLLDGDYDKKDLLNSQTIAVSEFREKNYAGSYLHRDQGNAANWTSSSLNEVKYNRACGVGVYPVLDKTNPRHPFTRANFGDITKYWPGYNNKKKP